MKPISMLQIKALSDYQWEIRQKFRRLGKYEVWVMGWGATKADALACFEQEKIYAEYPYDFDLLQDMGNFLWEMAGFIDQGIKALRDTMKVFFYDLLINYYFFMARKNLLHGNKWFMYMAKADEIIEKVEREYKEYLEDK